MKQEQKDIFHITVNNRQEFDVSSGEAEELDMVQISENNYHLLYRNKSYSIHVEEINEDIPSVSLKINGKQFELEIETPLIRKIQELGLAEEDLGFGEEVRAPMPGKVISVLVQEDEEVEPGQDLLILEAMKMENVIKSSSAGIVQSIQVKEGDAVDKNALLLNIEAGED